MGAQRFGWTSILAGLLFAFAVIGVIELVERQRSADPTPMVSDGLSVDEQLLGELLAIDVAPPDMLADEVPTPAYSYIRSSAFTGAAQIPAAIKADKASAHDVLEALGVPVTTDAFTPAFYDHRLFDRMIEGDISDIGQLKLPRQIEHVLLLRLSEPQRNTVPSNSNAIILTTTVEGAVIDVPARTVELWKFAAAGVGRDDEGVLRASLRGDMAPRLEPLRTSLTSRAGM